MTAPKIYFVRHGESEANARHVFAGIRDNSHLTTKGRAQARAAAEDMVRRKIRIDHIVASPLDRTRQTADIIAAGIGFDPAKIIYDKRLAEYDMGLLSGGPVHDISSAEITAHEEAEDPAAFKQRILEAITAAKQWGGHVLIVSHTGTGRMLEATIKRVNPRDFWDMPDFANGQVTELPLSDL